MVVILIHNFITTCSISYKRLHVLGPGCSEYVLRVYFHVVYLLSLTVQQCLAADLEAAMTVFTQVRI